MSTAPERPWLVVAATTVAVLLYSIDVTIANVALPNIQGSLQATLDQTLWVLTSYIVTSALCMPLVGYLAIRFGERRILLLSVVGFTLASMACGVAISLEQLVLFRGIQGAFGAALLPISQAALLRAFTGASAARAMGVWTVGVMVGPVIGPTLGGWLTETSSWRWVFFVNAPVGLMAWLLLATSLPKDHGSNNRPFDVTGFVLLSVSLLTLQLMFDRGNHLDWFASGEIFIEGVVGATALAMFLVHMLTATNPFFDRAVFRDRNLMAGTLAMIAIYPLILIVSALLPTFLQQLQNHSATSAGMLMAPRGVGIAIGSVVSTRLMQYFRPLTLMTAGFAIIAIANWPLVHLSLGISASTIGFASFVQGIGLGTTFGILMTASMLTLTGPLRTEGSVVTTLIRSIAGAIAISLIGNYLGHSTIENRARLAESITVFDALPRAAQNIWLLDAEVQRQANVIAYGNAFLVLTAFAAIALIAAVLMKVPRNPSAPSSSESTAAH
ncbi:MAG: DHA2 family efflux MFS transporter permease subunit [Steroidobacteraceae bacterium]